MEPCGFNLLNSLTQCEAICLQLYSVVHLLYLKKTQHEISLTLFTLTMQEVSGKHKIVVIVFSSPSICNDRVLWSALPISGQLLHCPLLRQTGLREDVSVGIDPQIIQFVQQLSLKELDQFRRRETKSPQSSSERSEGKVHFPFCCI